MNFTADLHAHIALPEKEPSDEQIKAKLNAYKETGVTYLRDGGDNCGASLKAKKFAEELGLDYVTPGFAIYKEDHYGSFLGKSFKTLMSTRPLSMRRKKKALILLSSCSPVSSTLMSMV